MGMDSRHSGPSRRCENRSVRGTVTSTMHAAGTLSCILVALSVCSRLVRLSKLLRLARMKRLLAKYGGDVHLQSYISVAFSLFVIFFLVHFMTW